MICRHHASNLSLARFSLAVAADYRVWGPDTIRASRS